MIIHPSAINMLPHPSSPEFPSALKARRELRGMSRAALARAANIHEVMPRRYEEPECGEFARPRPETTWLALNRALGYEIPDDLAKDFSALHAVRQEGGLLFSSSIPDPEDHLYEINHEPAALGLATPESGKSSFKLLLSEASLEDVVRHLHSKNIEPTFRFISTKGIEE